MVKNQLTSHHTTNLTEVTDVELFNGMKSAINLMENTFRGLVGEVLVALALDGRVTDSWSPWDVTLSDGTRVEVKTSGPIQAWPQDKAYKPSWDVGRHKAWILMEDGYVFDETLEHRSDLYVFAIHDGAQPQSRDEGTFLVVPTETGRRRVARSEANHSFIGVEDVRGFGIELRGTTASRLGSFSRRQATHSSNHCD